MVVPPTDDVIKMLLYILEKHDIAEEDPDGMYDMCVTLTHDQTKALLQQFAAVTEVPVHPLNTSDFALGAAKRAVARAGYDFDEICKE